jgi:FkbM family methyltransferase
MLRAVRRKLPAPVRALYRSARREYHRRSERILTAHWAGFVIYYPSRSAIGRTIASGRDWDPSLARIVTSLIPDDEPLIVEVGSNIGASLLEIKQAKPDARVHCYEPSSRFYPLLLRTIEGNAFEGVTPVQKMLSRSRQTLTLFSNATTGSAATQDYADHEYVGSESLLSSTLDAEFADCGPVSLIKTDTDGFDHEVLLGASALLGRDRPVLYFEFAPFLIEEAGEHPIAVLEYLRDSGYGPFLALSASSGRPLTLAASPEDLVVLARAERYVDVVTVHAGRIAQVGALPELLRSLD